jgi:outer membrane protein
LLLTYKEAVKIALKNNVNLNQQKNILASRQVQRNAAIAGFTPSIYAQGRAARNEGQQQNPENGNFENLTIDNVFGSLNAEMDLFNGFSNVNTFRQNVSQFKAQTSNVKRTEQDVIASVTNQFLQVLLDQELMRIAEEVYRAQVVNLEQTREQVRVGARAEADLYNQDALVKNQEVTLMRARVTFNNDKATLAQTLQLDTEVPFRVEFPSWSRFDINLNEIQLDSFYQIALTNREDLKQQKHITEANRFTLRSSANGYYPRLTLFASYGSVYYSNIPGSFNTQFFDVNLNLSYGISFYIPIFDRLQTRSTRVFNRVTMENSELQLENLEKTIKIQVLNAYQNYQAAIQNYRAGLVQLQSGELALRTQQESYSLGVSNQLALAVANQTYVQAAASKAQAEVTLLFQKMLLDYALGTLKFDDIPE